MWSLLQQRRFLPYFIVQSLGALNDNVYKNALLIFLAFQLSAGDTEQSHLLINLSAALFVLPFFLFSALFGQVADKYEKSILIQRVKLLEISIMGLACVGFYLQNPWFLMAVLFLMGTQSALFGPLKYSILPQQLNEHELTAGNGLVQMGTFIAIILGTLFGGILVYWGIFSVAITVFALAIFGYIASLFLPQTPATDATLDIDWNPWRQTKQLLRFTRARRSVFMPVLGIAWFWFYGATYLTQLPNYTRLNLGADETVVSLLLTLFALGIGLGSLLCAKLSGKRVEPGLVPIGAFGLSVFGLDLFFARPDLWQGETLINVFAFTSTLGNWRIIIDILLLGIFGGFYIVPLYTLMQQRSEASQRARIVAGSNIISALFMVLSALFAMLLLSTGLQIPHLFLSLAIMNAMLAWYIHNLAPEFLMRFLVWLLVHTFYSVRTKGLDNIPEKGAAVLVCNHVSFVDALIIAAFVHRPVRFVMDYRIFANPWANFIFRTAKAIPIASRRDNPELLDKAYERMAETLEKGELLMIFPEGKITYDGELNPFKRGIEKIIERTPAPVVPMALSGLWQSYFSRKAGKAMYGLPKKFYLAIGLSIAEPVPADKVSAASLQTQVQALRERP